MINSFSSISEVTPTPKTVIPSNMAKSDSRDTKSLSKVDRPSVRTTAMFLAKDRSPLKLWNCWVLIMYIPPEMLVPSPGYLSTSIWDMMDCLSPYVFNWKIFSARSLKSTRPIWVLEGPIIKALTTSLANSLIIPQFSSPLNLILPDPSMTRTMSMGLSHSRANWADPVPKKKANRRTPTART